MSPARPLRERRWVRLFIATHMAAIALFCCVAWVGGGGLAPLPLPPDEVVVAHTVPAPAPGPATARDVPTERDETQALLPGRTELTPPWTFDADVRARFTER